MYKIQEDEAPALDKRVCRLISYD